MTHRSEELKHRINPNIQLGLSYHNIKNGFTHYSVFELSEEQRIPDKMVEIKIPQWTYVKTTYEKGKNIQQTYLDLFHWIKENGYSVLKEDGIKYLDPLPIKHEYYSLQNNSQYNIYIPIQPIE